HLARGLAGLGSMYCFFYALGHLPLADAVLLNYSLPLFMPFVENVWLGEQFPSRLWGAIGLGFAGIVLILKPGLGLFQPAAVVGLQPRAGLARGALHLLVGGVRGGARLALLRKAARPALGGGDGVGGGGGSAHPADDRGAAGARVTPLQGSSGRRRAAAGADCRKPRSVLCFCTAGAGAAHGHRSCCVNGALHPAAP